MTLSVDKLVFPCKDSMGSLDTGRHEHLCFSLADDDGDNNYGGEGDNNYGGDDDYQEEREALASKIPASPASMHSMQMKMISPMMTEGLIKAPHKNSSNVVPEELAKINRVVKDPYEDCDVESEASLIFSENQVKDTMFFNLRSPRN